MSRTYRLIPNGCIRSIRTHSTRKLEQAALDSLRDAGYGSSNRLQSRANHGIPTAWDDIPIAAMAELPDHFWEFEFPWYLRSDTVSQLLTEPR